MSKNESEELISRDKPFPSWLKKFVDVDNSTYIELRSGERLYDLGCQWLSKKVDSHSYRISIKENASEASSIIERLARKAHQGKDYIENDEEKKESKKKTQLELGLGLHTFKYNNEKVFALHQTLGEPASCGYSSTLSFFESLILIINGKEKINILKNLCADIIREGETNKDKLFFNIYRYNIQQQYWQNSGRKIARNIDTIILPEDAKNKILKDVERFLDEKSIEWYFEHGIPYKRSYLFYGTPGSGKSSLIQAIAAKFDRNLCFLQPTHPLMTDDTFKTCIQSAPNNSLIILEDIDALFNKDRSKKHEQCPLTFSGLLNGLDGVGNPDGQIFILSTNFVDQLDNALIRSGRVDVHIQFPLATDEQLFKIFTLFYPFQNKLAKEFIDQIRKNFPSGISMAAIQQHFIQNMLSKPEETVENVPQLGERLDVVQKLDEKTKIKDEKEQKEKEKEPKVEDKKQDEKEQSHLREKIVNNLKGVLSSQVVDDILNTLETHIPILAAKNPSSDNTNDNSKKNDNNSNNQQDIKKS